MKEKNSSNGIERFQQILEIPQLILPSMDEVSRALVNYQLSAYIEGLKIVMQSIYEKLEHLEVLILECSQLMFPFLAKVGDRLYLNHSSPNL